MHLFACVATAYVIFLVVWEVAELCEYRRECCGIAPGLVWNAVWLAIFLAWALYGAQLDDGTLSTVSYFVFSIFVVTAFAKELMALKKRHLEKQTQTGE